MRFGLKLQNVRRGFATNSSSSHSLVYFDSDRPGHDTDESLPDDTEFGWQVFKLCTRRQKLVYALTGLFQSEGMNVGWSSWRTDADQERAKLDEYKREHPGLEAEIDAASSGYIDHQSVTSHDRLFAAALDPRVEIWGGNDNGDSPLDDGPKPDGYVEHEELGY